MKWADAQGIRSEARRGLQATCPLCKGEVLPKCGRIIAWHWAHKTKDCDSWSEPESDWHRDWKNQFPSFMQEVVVGPHRADVKATRGVIEFQRSPIAQATIQERESFYQRMAWVVDSAEFFFSSLDKNERPLPEGMYRWLWMRKSWLSASMPIFFDDGGCDLLRVTSLGPQGYFRFVRISKRAFIEQWTGLLDHQRLLPQWHHPLYSYLRNSANAYLRWDLGPNHGIWGGQDV